MLPRVEFVRDEDGEAIEFIHICTGGRETTARLPLYGKGWQKTDDGGITPSILCGVCNVHGFWIGGNSPHWMDV